MKRHNSANTESKGAAAAAWGALGLSALLAAAPLSSAASVSVGAGMDYYNYANAGNKGGAAVVPVFAILGTGDDNRLGQYALGFNTGSALPAGLGASNYVVSSVTLRLTVASGNAPYDPTYDSLATYLTDEGAVVDADAGRPLELYALGFRNGFTGVGFEAANAGPPLFSEGSPYGGASRNAFAADLGTGLLRDVTDSVSAGFEAQPLAVGQVIGLEPGAELTAGTPVVFSLDLSNEHVLAYVQESLDAGALGLSLASLHAVLGPGAGVYPAFHTREAANAAFRPELTIEYASIPEPGVAALALWALAGVGWRRARRG